MLSVKDLRSMAGTYLMPKFVRELGPFVLIQKPPDDLSTQMATKLAAGRTMLADRLPSQQGLSMLLQFDNLEVATLPPMDEGARLTVGRLPDCDLVVDDPSVSKRHATLRWDSQKKRCAIQDLESMNGTLVNGSALGARLSVLRDGDIISFGDAQFCYLHTETLYVKIIGRRASAPAPASRKK